MATIVKLVKSGGNITVSQDLAALFSTLRNGNYTITIKRATEKRTIAQNDLMWMWFACIEQETGTPKDDIYMYYCKKFLCKVIRIGSKMEKIYETSSRLNTGEFSEFLGKIQADAAAELGITLPTPEDLYFEAFYNRFNY